MNKVLDFCNPKDFSYITGSCNEPKIVGVKGATISMQFACNLRDFMMGGAWVTREELIAFVLATGIYDDIKRSDNNEE